MDIWKMAATEPENSDSSPKPKSELKRKTTAVEPNGKSGATQASDLTSISISTSPEGRKEKQKKSKAAGRPSPGNRLPKNKPTKGGLESHKEKKNVPGRLRFLILKRIFQFLVLVFVICFFALVAYLGISMIIHPKEKITSQLTNIFLKKDFKISLTLGPDNSPANMKVTDQTEKKDADTALPPETGQTAQKDLTENHKEVITPQDPSQKPHESDQTERPQAETEQSGAAQTEVAQSSAVEAGTEHAVADLPESIQAEDIPEDQPVISKSRESKDLKNRYEITLQSGKIITVDNIVVGNNSVTFMDQSGLVVSLDSSEIKSVNRQSPLR